MFTTDVTDRRHYRQALLRVQASPSMSNSSISSSFTAAGSIYVSRPSSISPAWVFVAGSVFGTMPFVSSWLIYMERIVGTRAVGMYTIVVVVYLARQWMQQGRPPSLPLDKKEKMDGSGDPVSIGHVVWFRRGEATPVILETPNKVAADSLAAAQTQLQPLSVTHPDLMNTRVIFPIEENKEELEDDEQGQEEEKREDLGGVCPSAGHPVNLSGAYKLVSNNGFEEFLKVQGVSWPLRRAANQARPTHHITHNGSELTIRIEGIIESQTTYTINGPPVETNVRGRIFQDTVGYLKNGRGIIVSKRAVSENYDVTVQRELSEDRKEIIMTSTAFFKNSPDPPVRSIQVFQRME